MTSQSDEQFLKKKLQNFLNDMLQLGTVKGFKYLAMYMRGREELVASIVNEPVSPNNSYSSEPTSPLSSSYNSGMTGPSLSSSFHSANLPYDKRSLMLSQRSQRTLSGHGEREVGLPPASPSHKEITQTDEGSTLFLLAAYARYSCPYVWVRSNHQRIVKLTGEKEEEKDNPLKLKSTAKWKDHDIQPWDVLAEVVKLCTYPPPRNPLAVDWEYFDRLPLQERVIAQGALINTLNRVIMGQVQDRYYTAKVLEDLQKLTKNHFSDLQQLVQGRQLPILKEKPVARQQHQHGNHGNLQQQAPRGYTSQATYQKTVLPTGPPPNTYSYKYQTGMF